MTPSPPNSKRGDLKRDFWGFATIRQAAARFAFWARRQREGQRHGRHGGRRSDKGEDSASAHGATLQLPAVAAHPALRRLRQAEQPAMRATRSTQRDLQTARGGRPTGIVFACHCSDGASELATYSHAPRDDRCRTMNGPYNVFIQFAQRFSARLVPAAGMSWRPVVRETGGASTPRTTLSAAASLASWRVSPRRCGAR